MKKKITTIFQLLLPCLAVLPLAAQQVPVFNSHLYTPELYNPARMGDGFIGLNYRHQWMDLDPQYAPVSYSLVADLSSVLSLDGKRIGIGFNLLSDKAHLMKRYNAAFSFAYRLVDEPEHRLALGVLAGVTSQRYDFNNARIFDPYDRAIFSEQQNLMVFDGGPGLYYAFQPSDEHRLSIDVSVPQLFNSDLNFDDGGLFDVQPHLQARVGYRYTGSAFSIEPLVAYRELIGDKKLKAGNLDLALRLGFLDDRVWIGGGTRLDAEALHISIGVKPITQLQVLAAIELNSIFGNTFELGALYNFGSAPAKIDFAQEMESSQSALTKTLVQESEIKMSLQTMEAKIAVVEQPGFGTEEKRRNAEEVRTEIQQSRARLDMIRDYQSQANGAKTAASTKAGNSRSATKMKDFKTINDNAVVVNDIADKMNNAVNATEQHLNNAASRLPPEITEAVRKGNLPAIRAFFQERLDELTDKPRNTQPIVVEAADRSILVRYEFFNQVEQYDIGSHRDLTDIKSLANHIAAEIKTLRDKGLTVESVQVTAVLRDNEKALRSIKAGTYKGEFGNTTTLNYKFITTSTGKITAKTKAIKNKEGINLEQLTALKLYGIRSHLAKQDTGGRVTFEDYEIAAPNSEQIYTQMYRVEIKMR